MWGCRKKAILSIQKSPWVITLSKEDWEFPQVKTSLTSVGFEPPTSELDVPMLHRLRSEASTGAGRGVKKERDFRCFYPLEKCGESQKEKIGKRRNSRGVSASVSYPTPPPPFSCFTHLALATCIPTALMGLLARMQPRHNTDNPVPCSPTPRKRLLRRLKHARCTWKIF